MLLKHNASLSGEDVKKTCYVMRVLCMWTMIKLLC